MNANTMKGQFFLVGALLLISAFFIGFASIREAFVIVPDRDMSFLSGNVMGEYPNALNLGLNSTGGLAALENFSRFLNASLSERYVDFQALWIESENVSSDVNITVGNWLHATESVTLSIGGNDETLTVAPNATNYTSFLSPGASFSLAINFSQSNLSVQWRREKASLYVYTNMSRGGNIIIEEEDY